MSPRSNAYSEKTGRMEHKEWDRSVGGGVGFNTIHDPQRFEAMDKFYKESIAKFKK